MSESSNQRNRSRNNSISSSVESYSLHGQSSATEEDLEAYRSHPAYPNSQLEAQEELSNYRDTQRVPGTIITIEDLANQIALLQIQVAALSTNNSTFGSPAAPRVFENTTPTQPVIAVLAEYQVNDQVRIRNPRGRPNRATVTGFTRTGQVQLLLSDNSRSRRATQNLVLVSRPEQL